MELAATDNESNAHLIDLTEDTAFVCQIISIACYFVITVSAYAMFITIAMRKAFKGLPVKVKISLIAYLLYAPAMVALMILVLLQNKGWGIIIYFGSKWRGLTAVGYSIWMA